MKHVETHISSALTETEWSVLKSFCVKTDRLRSTKLAINGKGITGNVNYDISTGLSFEATLPPEELITELLMAFRFFYLQKEKTHFYSILNLLCKHSVETDARKVLGIFRTQWANSLFARTMNIKFNDTQITSGLLLDLWFNAHYFHTDEDKEKELLKLKDVFTEDFAKYMLLDSVFEAIKIIYKVHDGVKGIVDEHYNP